MGQVSFAEIILAVDGPLDATQSAGAERCPDGLQCQTDDLWAKLNEHILGYLGSVSLGQLVEDQKATATDVTPVQDMRDTTPKRALVTSSV
jgi:Rrf2 family iron-sulfur cluster assembly transcriptional regulator